MFYPSQHYFSATSCGPIEPIANGTVTCTDGSDIASQCTFECDKSQGLQLYPATIEQNQCLIQADGTAKWFPPTPCCSRKNLIPY